MTYESTYYELFKYNTELNNFAIQYPAVAKMLANGYHKFESRNKMALKYLSEKLTTLYEQNVCKDENGQYELAGEDWKFKSSVHKEEFAAEWQRVMNMKVTIVIGDENISKK